MAITIFGTLYICGATYFGTNEKVSNNSKMFYFIVMSIIMLLICFVG